jgi:serine/threonine protein kinase
MPANDLHPLPNELTRFLTGRLPEPELERIAAHLESCPACLGRLPSHLPDDPLVAALKRPLQPEPCAEEPECVSTVEFLASQGPSTVPLPGTGETASYPRLGSDVTPHVAAARGAPPAFDPLPCDFGRYRILKRLGQGGMGAVYLADDRLLQRRVALKVSRFEEEAGPEAEERFRREARAAAALMHDGICPVFDYGVEQGVPFITMAYIEGQSLYQVLKESKRLQPGAAAELVRQAALALAEAHRHGVLHRDLKPANILLDSKGRPRVVDFGLAKRAEDVTLTRPGATAGTPAYMSPEQVQGDPLTAATDIYSLGVILYQLLTGRLPYPGSSMTELSYQIVHRPVEPPSAHCAGLDPRLDAICRKAMAKSAKDRYAAMSELAAELEGFVPSAARTSPPAPRVKLHWWHGAAAASVLLALIVGFLFWMRGSEDAGTARDPKLATAATSSGKIDSGQTPTTSASGKEEHRMGGADKQPALKGSMDVRIWEPGNPLRQGLGLRDGGLPLQARDWVAVEVGLSRPAYAYIIWISANGRADPIYPWTPGRWQARPTEEQKVTHLRLPSAEEKWPMRADDPAGMETLVLLARETPLERSVPLKDLVGELGRQPRQDTRSAVWFENFEPVVSGTLRAPNFFDVKRLEDPVLRTQRELRSRLGSHFTYSTAVSFANLGRNKDGD